MIHIKPQLTYKEGFVVEGHGKDIACAAASFLSQVIGQEIASTVKAKYYEELGHTELIIYAQNHDTDVLMRLFQNAMISLADHYPNHVSFQFAVPLTFDEVEE